MISQARLSTRSGRRFAVPYVATTAAAAVLEVRRGRKLVARLRGRARAGRNSLRVAARPAARRKALKRGRYTLRLALTSADGQTARDSARLTVRR